MKTAQITYYGSGPLSLQMRRFRPGVSVRSRLDDILPDERRRYWDRFLIIGPDGLIINIGSMVPKDVVKSAIGTNPRVLTISGFGISLPSGYGLDNRGAEPKIVDAATLAAEMSSAEDLEPASASDVINAAGTEPSPDRPEGPGNESLEGGDEDDGKEEGGDQDPEGAGGEEGSVQPGKKNGKESDGTGAEDAPDGSRGGRGQDGGGAGSDAGDSDRSEEGPVISVKGGGPTLTDAPAKKAAAKKRAPAKKAAKKKPAAAKKKVSKADDLMEMF